MVRNVISINGKEHLKTAVDVITREGISGLPVVDDSGRLLGALSERDVIMALELVDLQIEVRDVMNPTPSIVKADQPLFEIFELFREKGLRRAIVCDDENRVLGIIGRRDLLRVHMDSCMAQNRAQRATMRRPSSSFELGPLLAHLEQTGALAT